MRASYHAKEGDKKMKQKMRDRMQPKMGKLDIDYAILHDAFFKHQRPPTMSGWGELYYEGKEFEPNVWMPMIVAAKQTLTLTTPSHSTKTASLGT